ncbi:YidH family protein [uncultured Amnibacterium sp.]|uniref:YidH family protein n=1 Tax=uncultured Amnibacterium sp. TaxID=1631851 RepID=UPI0035CA22A5
MTHENRMPRSVYGVGSEPDPRFTMANERTFLAWIRTALACIAGGVAIDAIALPMPEPLRLATAAILLLLGLVVPALAWRSWAVTERALRLDRPLPASPVAAVLAAGVLLVAVLVIVGTLIT